MLQPNMTVSGHKYEQMQETSHNLQHLGIRMMHDLNARRNNVEEAYKKAIEIGLEPEHITDSMPFTPGNGMAEIQQAAEKTMQKPVFSFFKKMKRSHKYIQREVKKAFEELEQRKRRERRGSGGIGKSTTTTIT